MFLVTLIDPAKNKLIRKVFNALHDAEEYCDFSASCGYMVASLEKCDFFPTFEVVE